jgi:hypothetical protein
MPAWSVAGIPLEGQSFGAVDDAAIYQASGAVGTIGSDVLARFGAVRIDYKAETMTVEGGEGKPIGGLTEAAEGPLPKGLVRERLQREDLLLDVGSPRRRKRRMVDRGQAAEAAASVRHPADQVGPRRRTHRWSDLRRIRVGRLRLRRRSPGARRRLSGELIDGPGAGLRSGPDRGRTAR